MKYLITESRLKELIFKYYDKIFKDSFIIEDDDWWGITTTKFNRKMLIGYEKKYPNTMYYWGDGIDVDFIETFFDLPVDEQKYYLSDYIKEKFNLKFLVLI